MQGGYRTRLESSAPRSARLAGSSQRNQPVMRLGPGSGPKATVRAGSELYSLQEPG